MQPKVSVCITTYNHEKYIAQALDSVLLQNTDFNFEILVGEDDSSDRTREIVKGFAEKYPDKIRLFLNDRKNVIYIDGKPTGRANMLKLLSEARGEFIALCEGDDYWTDKTKLERQVEILQTSPKCSLVFHNASVLGDEGNEKNFSEGLSEGFYDIESVILKPWFVPTPSIMFRRGLFEFGEWKKHVYNFDLSIQLTLAAKFPLYYIDRKMSVYRVHDGGVSSGREPLFHSVKLIETLCLFNSISSFEYDDLIKERLDNIRVDMRDYEYNTLTSSSDVRHKIFIEEIASSNIFRKIMMPRYYPFFLRNFLKRCIRSS